MMQYPDHMINRPFSKILYFSIFGRLGAQVNNTVAMVRFSRNCGIEYLGK